MNKKKTFVGVALLVAVLMLGVGYAAIADVKLNVTGNVTANPSDANFKVEFTGTPQKSTGVEASISETNKLEATIDVTGLTQAGDVATATYTIINNSEDLTANLTASVIENSNDEYFKVTPTLASSSIAKGVSTTLEVKVELIKTPVAGDETGTIKVQVNAAAAQPTSGN